MRCKCSHLEAKHRKNGSCFVNNCSCRQFRVSEFYNESRRDFESWAVLNGFSIDNEALWREWQNSHRG